MCRLCDAGMPQRHRRDFLKAVAAGGAAATGLELFAPRPAAATDGEPPSHSGRHGRRYLIRGGAVMSLDPKVGDFASADVLVEGNKIAAVGPSLSAAGAAVIDARNRIVMPGFVDTHHHLFETALRSFLADGILVPDSKPHGVINYFEYILQKFAPVYRVSDVYINELFGSLSQLDCGVTTVHDISQIHHSRQHSEAVYRALVDSGRRGVLGYFESSGARPGNEYPDGVRHLKDTYFASTDQLVSLIMGGEIYLPGYEKAWALGRELGLQVAAHIVGTFGMRPEFDKLADAGAFGPDNLFIHVTGMSDNAWAALAKAGAAVSLAVPIEMIMRHGDPPLLKAQPLEPSLSSDVECTLTADFFTQMRSCMALQRAIVNQRALNGETDLPELLTSRDVIRYATINGARHLRLDKKVGSLTPGKEADIIILDAAAINVAPLNHVPGAVVSLMERSNVESVIVAGKIRKWKGRLLNVNLSRLRRELENSRDYLFSAAGIPQNLFR